MLSWQDKTILVVAPHPDDEVIGCGGLISKVKSQGGRVFVIYLTVGATADFNATSQSTQTERTNEIEKVTDYLQLDGWRLAFAGDDFHLQLDQMGQKRLINEIERGQTISLEHLRPNVLIFPHFADYNQDHRAAAQACFTACRPARPAEKFVPELILAYEAPMHVWNPGGEGPVANFLVTLSQGDIDHKVSAMDLYTSQTREVGHPRHGGTLRALAQLRGAAVGVPWAEGYYCHKMTV